MLYRRVIVLAMIAGLPGVARAQFTTFIPPRNKGVDSAKAVVVAQAKTHADSAVNIQLTNMKTWVDSAAGVAPVPTMAVATSMSAAATVPAASTRMRKGLRAPATASALPLIGLIGALTLGLGVFLVAIPQSARNRA